MTIRALFSLPFQKALDYIFRLLEYNPNSVHSHAVGISKNISF